MNKLILIYRKAIPKAQNFHIFFYVILKRNFHGGHAGSVTAIFNTIAETQSKCFHDDRAEK